MTARYRVAIEEYSTRPTLVIPATTSWPEFPTIWPSLLNEVWALLNANGIQGGCPNIMMYLDETPRVEVGVLYSGNVELTGRVITSSLPAGRVATTVHRGDYGGLAGAHRSVLDWCRGNGIPIGRTHWEEYGPHSEDPGRVWTRVCWALS